MRVNATRGARDSSEIRRLLHQAELFAPLPIGKLVRESKSIEYQHVVHVNRRMQISAQPFESLGGQGDGTLRQNDRELISVIEPDGDGPDKRPRFAALDFPEQETWMFAARRGGKLLNHLTATPLGLLSLRLAL
jgi:hypothetical protein